jgi:hypothetical protein
MEDAGKLCSLGFISSPPVALGQFQQNKCEAVCVRNCVKQKIRAFPRFEEKAEML